MEIITFGKKEEGIQYIWRPAVYGILWDCQKDRLALIQTGDGKFFLPGGGMEGSETHEECLKREALEVMRMDIEIGPYLGAARKYFYSTNQYNYYLSEGHFYICTFYRISGEPSEPDNFLTWIEPAQAFNLLFHEHQSWAVSEALKA